MNDFNEKDFDKFISKNTIFSKEGPHDEWARLHHSIFKNSSENTRSFWDNSWVLVAATVFSLLMVVAVLPKQSSNEIDQLIQITLLDDTSRAQSQSLVSIDEFENIF